MSDIVVGPVKDGVRRISYPPLYLRSISIGSVFNPVLLKIRPSMHSEHRHILYLDQYPALRAMIERLEEALTGHVLLKRNVSYVHVKFPSQYTEKVVSMRVSLPTSVPDTNDAMVVLNVDSYELVVEKLAPTPAERAIYERLERLEAKLDAFVNAVTELRALQ